MDTVALKAMKQRASVASRRERRSREVASFRALFEETVRKEVRAIRSVLETGAGALESWMDSFYLEHQEEMRSSFEPTVFGFGSDIVEIALEEVDSGDPVQTELFAAEYTAALAGRWVSSSKAQIGQVLRDGETEAAEMMEERLDKWSERRPVWAAEREATQSESAFTKLAYLTAGITQLVWMTSGGPCPICAELEGRVVGITEPFVRQGQPVGPDEDGRQPVRPQINIGHPPLHGLDGRGGVCQCSIAAA